jgi:hypothetical protein
MPERFTSAKLHTIKLQPSYSPAGNPFFVKSMFSNISSSVRLFAIALFFHLQHTYIQILHFLPGPGRFAQKCKAGFYARVIDEAVDGDYPPQILPAKKANQFGQYCF